MLKIIYRRSQCDMPGFESPTGDYKEGDSMKGGGVFLVTDSSLRIINLVSHFVL
jgi:hypothetical protein